MTCSASCGQLSGETTNGSSRIARTGNRGDCVHIIGTVQRPLYAFASPSNQEAEKSTIAADLPIVAYLFHFGGV
jgi:hypothetical protein